MNARTASLVGDASREGGQSNGRAGGWLSAAGSGRRRRSGRVQERKSGLSLTGNSGVLMRSQGVHYQVGFAELRQRTIIINNYAQIYV